MPAKWRIAIPLAVVVVVLVGASIWMFAKDDASTTGAAKPRGRGAGTTGTLPPTSSTIPGQGKDTGLSEPVSGELVLYGVPSVQAALVGLKAGFEAANPDATVTIVSAPVLDLVAELVRDPRPGAVIAPTRAMDAIKGVSSQVGDAVPMGRNLFVIAVPRGNPKGIDSIEVMAADSGERVVACGPNSPYGNFAQIVLDEAGVDVADGTVQSTCGTAAINQIATGQLDAALVMRTAKNRRVSTVPIPEDINVIIRVSIAQVGDDPASAAMLTYTGSEAGTSILNDRGFKP